MSGQTMPPIHPSAATRQRRGSAYVAVLGTALLVATIGFTSLLTSRAKRESAALEVSQLQARALARSAIELGLQMIGSDPQAHLNQGTGDWITNLAFGNGTLHLSAVLIDDNDDLVIDRIEFTGRGVYRGAEQTVRVDVEAVSSLGGWVIAPGAWRPPL